MERRAFLACAGAILLAPPLTAEAQPVGKLPRVGLLSPGSSSDPLVQPYLDVFRGGLREFGYVEGQSIIIEYRWAEGKYERLPDLATGLVSLKVDVIVAVAVAVRAAAQATKTIPIVMASADDPVATGLVASIARPGGNITGLSIIAHDLVGKQLQLLREVVPKVSSVAILWNPANRSHTPQLREAEAAAQALGVQLHPLEAQSPAEIDRVFVAMTTARVGALLVLLDSMLLLQRERIADLAAKNRLPAVYGLRWYADAGGLVTYGANQLAQTGRIASYVDRILKGAKPGDLPIEQPTRFELVINLKTAKALGLTIPPSLLGRADELIQ
jgi:putative tryptophan/tyrosine transport system substrate-binding protein